ncbi:MAG: hypothetical protein AAGA91_09960 [Pseudomonadota bacterium]
MSDDNAKWCVLLPCSQEETWAVPQNCLAEIVTVPTRSEQPPTEVFWRGREIPVLDFAADGEDGWREPRRGTGLIAVFLGLEGEACEYWGLAVRGEGLAAARVDPEEITDVPDGVADHATAAFELQGVVYQVPDLDGLQKQIALKQQAV